MNVLLVNPSWGGRVQRQRYNRRWPPLDLLNVAALLRADGFHVALRDARATSIARGDMAESVRWADLVIATTSPLDRWQCPNLDLQPLLEQAREIPREKLVLCGVHGTLFPESLMRFTGARMVIRGEPEDTAVALCRALRQGASLTGVPSLSCLEGGKIEHHPSGSPVALSSLPVPAYDLTEPGHYEYELMGERTAILETSRGCPHRCVYCLKTMYGSSLRMKPAEQVAREIEAVLEQGYRSIYFMDLEFSLDPRRTLELCRTIGPLSVQWCCQTRVDTVNAGLLEEMAKAGCGLIHFGIESGDPDVLKRIRKGITLRQVEDAVRWAREAGMATAGFFLPGLPREGPRAWKATEALARRLNPTYASFHIVTPYPGTELGEACHMDSPWWEEKKTGNDALEGRLRRTYLRYYLRPGYWMEFLRRGAWRASGLRLFVQFLQGMASRNGSGT